MKNTLKKLTSSQRDELLRYTDRIFYAAIHEGFDSKSAGEMAAKAAESKAKEMAQVSQMNPFRQPSESEEDFREMVQRDQEHFKPLEIVDSRMKYYGEHTRGCQCEDCGGPSIEQQIAELKAAGWIPLTRTCWKAPAGSGCAGVFLGPYGAWKAMKRRE